MKKYRFILLFFFIHIVNFSSAQKGSDRSKMPAIGHVYGKIIDSKTKDVIPYASVVFFKKDSIVAGVFTGNNGEFSMENLPFGKFNLQITSLGFKLYKQVVVISPQNEEQDLGDIKIEQDNIVLKDVEIVAERSLTEMSIDRKVFNVDKDLGSKGGTATDVMKNIPSVSLDENGNAQIRQNSALIYLDNKPTSLTLDQIPADQIEKVEVISNPSAKFEASATGGIINIVMKGNSKPGYYGAVSAGAGTNDHYNGMLSLNVKQKKIGFSVNYNYNSFRNSINAYNYRTNLFNGNTSGYYDSDNRKVFQHIFNTGSTGVDYYINNRNTLSLSGNMTIGDHDTEENQIFKSTGESRVVLNTGDRNTRSIIHFENYTGKLHYKKIFPKKGKELTADFNYNNSHSKSLNDFTTNTYNASGGILPYNPDLQNNVGKNQSQMYTLQADYVNPLNDSTRLELGIRSNYRPGNLQFESSRYSYFSKMDTVDPTLNSHYKIDDLINAAYMNYLMRYKQINFMFGLRFEDTYYKGTLLNKNDSSFHYSYPNSFNNIHYALFPGIFISKKFNEKEEAQFNLTRKINRPDFRQLMPFVFSSDRKNMTMGNPQLTPEFITTSELNINRVMNKGNLFASLFFRNTQNPLTGYTYRAPQDSSILISTTVNGRQSNTIGMENTFKYSLSKALETTVNANLFYSFIDLSYKDTHYSNQGFFYNAKFNISYRLPLKLSIQLSGNYESPKIIPQGKSKEMYFFDCGISKEAYKFMTFTLSVSDILDTKGRGTSLITDQFIQDYWSRRETRYLKFTAMIRFGKADATLFKKRLSTQQGDSDVGF